MLLLWYVEGQQIIPPAKALRSLWQTNDLAQEMGKELGASKILQRSL